MNYTDCIQNHLQALQATINQMELATLHRLAGTLNAAMQQQAAIYIFGNGGSACLATHFVADLGKMLKLERNENFRIYSLNDNISVLTAWANDSGYENVFWRQLELYLRPGDIVFAISGSGNSPNVIQAVEYARNQGNFVMSLTGFGGGKLAPLSDISYVVPASNMQIVEDVFGIILHALFVALRDGQY
ncbi:SIS domain-containing protein [candidate division KSB1 bacterium]|nr:SIS domain-containing protein [candidate division KSB1 bacterium]